MNDTVINIRISKELANQIKETAKEKNISTSALIKMVMSEYMKKQSK